MDEQFEMREGMHNLTKEKISYLLETKNKTPWKNGRALYRRFHCHLGRESRQIEDRPGFQRRCKYKAMAQIEAPEAEKVELNKKIAVITKHYTKDVLSHLQQTVDETKNGLNLEEGNSHKS